MCLLVLSGDGRKGVMPHIWFIKPDLFCLYMSITTLFSEKNKIYCIFICALQSNFLVSRKRYLIFLKTKSLFSAFSPSRPRWFWWMESNADHFGVAYRDIPPAGCQGAYKRAEPNLPPNNLYRLQWSFQPINVACLHYSPWVTQNDRWSSCTVRKEIKSCNLLIRL